MSGWATHEGIAIGLPREGIDTDQLIPARFMSTPRSEGYGQFLLHDLRRNEDGTLDPDFPLNSAAAQGASILIAARNFGGGSSREAAVYALADAGFRVVAAPSFGDIFTGNAVNNGLLPARISEDDAQALLDALAIAQQGHADLDAANLSVGGLSVPFEIDAVARQKLMNGWDDIDLTRVHGEDIAAYREARVAACPWIIPRD